MICNNCGNQVNEGQFCSKCGTKEGAPPPVGAPMPPPMPPPPPPMGAPAPYNTAYRQQPPPPPPPTLYNEVPTIKNYVTVMLLAMIPIAGLVLMIIWAIGNDTPLWKTNYARAYFIVMAIGFVIGILFSFLFVGIIAAVFSGIGNAIYW